MQKPIIVTIDLEGVLIPEIWIELAEKIKIEKFRLTTRDVSDYDELMGARISLLDKNNITLEYIKNMTKQIEPLDGALDFLNWLKKDFEVIIVSDTFYEFTKHILPKLENTVLFCHSLKTDKNGMITGHKMREKGEKENVTKALKQIGFGVIAMGDSLNDINMLNEADYGLFLNASETTVKKHPNFPSAKNYEEAKEIISKKLK